MKNEKSVIEVRQRGANDDEWVQFADRVLLQPDKQALKVVD